MKTKQILTVLMLSIFCLSFSTASYAHTEKATFVTKMSCGGCKATIEKKLAATTGILEYKTDLATKEVWVHYDPHTISKAKVIEAIGYSAVDKSAQEVTFVTKMSCGGCKATIEKKLSGAEGVKEFKTDLPTKEVWVKYDGFKTDKAQLTEVIGYAAEEKK